MHTTPNFALDVFNNTVLDAMQTFAYGAAWALIIIALVIIAATVMKRVL